MFSKSTWGPLLTHVWGANTKTVFRSTLGGTERLCFLQNEHFGAWNKFLKERYKRLAQGDHGGHQCLDQISAKKEVIVFILRYWLQMQYFLNNNYNINKTMKADTKTLKMRSPQGCDIKGSPPHQVLMKPCSQATWVGSDP